MVLLVPFASFGQEAADPTALRARLDAARRDRDSEAMDAVADEVRAFLDHPPARPPGDWAGWLDTLNQRARLLPDGFPARFLPVFQRWLDADPWLLGGLDHRGRELGYLLGLVEKAGGLPEGESPLSEALGALARQGLEAGVAPPHPGRLARALGDRLDPEARAALAAIVAGPDDPSPDAGAFWARQADLESIDPAAARARLADLAADPGRWSHWSARDFERVLREADGAGLGDSAPAEAVADAVAGAWTARPPPSPSLLRRIAPALGSERRRSMVAELLRAFPEGAAAPPGDGDVAEPPPLAVPLDRLRLTLEALGEDPVPHILDLHRESDAWRTYTGKDKREFMRALETPGGAELRERVLAWYDAGVMRDPARLPRADLEWVCRVLGPRLSTDQAAAWSHAIREALAPDERALRDLSIRELRAVAAGPMKYLDPLVAADFVLDWMDANPDWPGEDMETLGRLGRVIGTRNPDPRARAVSEVLDEAWDAGDAGLPPWRLSHYLAYTHLIAGRREEARRWARALADAVAGDGTAAPPHNQLEEVAWTLAAVGYPPRNGDAPRMEGLARALVVRARTPPPDLHDFITPILLGRALPHPEDRRILWEGLTGEDGTPSFYLGRVLAGSYDHTGEADAFADRLEEITPSRPEGDAAIRWGLIGHLRADRLGVRRGRAFARAFRWALGQDPSPEFRDHLLDLLPALFHGAHDPRWPPDLGWLTDGSLVPEDAGRRAWERAHRNLHRAGDRRAMRARISFRWDDRVEASAESPDPPDAPAGAQPESDPP